MPVILWRDKKSSLSLRKGSLILSIRLFSILLEDNAGVVSAEAERVAQGCTNGTLLCLVESIVERVVDLRVLVLLDAVVGDIVFRHFPGKREGFLTTTRSKLVQRETLNHLAKEMGINKLILSSGHQSGHNSNMAGNAFEALVGAIYLDKGYDACMRFMERQILGEMINIDKLAYKEVNFKSKLIEWCQKNRVQLNFKLLGNETSEEGAPVFHFVVMLEDVEGCDARGYSKKESQQKASKDTLRKLRKDTKFLDRVFASCYPQTRLFQLLNASASAMAMISSRSGWREGSSASAECKGIA